MRRLFCLLLLLSGFAHAAEPLKLTLAEYPPFIGDQLPGQGLLTTAVRAVFERAGYQVLLLPTPNNRAIESARQGEVDGSLGWARSPERERDLYYSAPVMNLRMVFCQRRGTSHPWQRLLDLAPYRIGVTLGNFYSDEFAALSRAHRLQVDAAPSDVANLRKLAAGRIDLFPIDAEVGAYLMQRYLDPVQRERLVCPNKAYWTAPLHVVISRRHPDGPTIIADFNRTLDGMQRSGEFAQLIDTTRKWIAGNY
ncbi:transporter substrate-binding domain-containing protein [Chitiniphilus purpureus]|uniref:Transporter substrate-binding domain-containing protein n=1 Tax=Chitiniphilus purpureus TaxID=2981137 RepID=A0ABY6DKQ0_9NEIS|nr:transporter substrate-binding domain-containing protein [Chitiniphilus sp. CD1]UXY14036.1 transporter substrate-binding domain-containing protein [Chitiniphilus sp. CD1]